MTSFVGRDSVVEEVVTLVRAHRLVTLTGAGGVGKSRTSLHVAANLVDGSGHGVWFVELASLQEAELIPIRIAGRDRPDTRLRSGSARRADRSAAFENASARTR